MQVQEKTKNWATKGPLFAQAWSQSSRAQHHYETKGPEYVASSRWLLRRGRDEFKLMWSCLDASKQYHWGALIRWSLEWYFCRNHPFWPSIMFRSGQHATMPKYKNINVHLSEPFLNAKQIFCHQIYKNAEAHQKTHNWKVQSWHCKCSQLLFCEPNTFSKHTQKTQRALSLRRILNLIEDVVLLASNFESWNRRNLHGVKHQSLSMFNPRAILSTCNPLCFLGLNHLATWNMVKYFSN